MEISVLTWTKEPCSTFVVVVGEALEPGDDRDDEVDEDTGDAKTGNEIVFFKKSGKFLFWSFKVLVGKVGLSKLSRNA